MSLTTSNRTLPWDWYAGEIPDNVALEPHAYLETTYSFRRFQGQAPKAVMLGRATTVYLGTMFDVGPRGHVAIGPFSLVNAAWIICDAAVEIGEYALISWNVVLLDSYRLPRDPAARRQHLARLAADADRRLPSAGEARPICIGRNVWIGFDCCVLPGVTIGDGSIVGARSVVTEDVPAYTLVAGNPARVVREIENDERKVPYVFTQGQSQVAPQP
jgi:acetyltransferase-like isoleucine patch superfamily enzyme